MDVLWIYMTNAVLLINHEIDSAYWKEWKLFGLPGGISGFLLLHFPVLFLVLYGMILVYEKTYTGMIFSVALGMAGIFAFLIHMLFLRRGHTEFKAPVSLFILVATLLVSIVQIVFTGNLLLRTST